MIKKASVLLLEKYKIGMPSSLLQYFDSVIHFGLKTDLFIFLGQKFLYIITNDDKLVINMLYRKKISFDNLIFSFQIFEVKYDNSITDFVF